MKLAVLSDIHGNIRALNAVIRDLGRYEVDQVANLGDCLYGQFGSKQRALSRQRVPLLAGDLELVVGNRNCAWMGAWEIWEHTLINLNHVRS